MPYLLRCTAALMLLLAGPVFAQTADEAAISNLLHATFDRPEVPLTIAPIVVAGDHAIAGWIQADMGGRALLRRKGEAWTLILCAGDGIKSQDTLAKAGIPARNAARAGARPCGGRGQAAAATRRHAVAVRGRADDGWERQSPAA